MRRPRTETKKSILPWCLTARVLSPPGTGPKCYDRDLWSAAIGRYREISSCSTFEAYQSRRANIRFRREQGAKPEFAHVLNGSGLATPRLFSAILETFQQPDGSLLIPEV